MAEATPARPSFVLHEHRRPRHHFDLRLEENGALRSWALPRGLPTDPTSNRLAVAVPDHDLDHLTYEDADKSIADLGWWEEHDRTEHRMLFTLHGRRGPRRYALIRTADNWLMHQTKDQPDWHPPLRRIKGSELSGQTGQTTGMTRREAISGRTVGSSKVWMGQTHVAPGTSSGDHHHGETETAIYVVSGRPEFVFAEGDTEVRIATEPGDYVFVPPFVPHREENPGGEEAVVVIARSSQEAVVVNLPSLRG